jgi:hypothetical protein
LLSERLQQQLKSEDALDRFSALIDLRDLIEGADRRLSEAALQALERLTGDDSRRVAASAQRLLDEEVGKPRSAARGGRRRAIPEMAEPAAIVPDAEPEVAVPDAVTAMPEAALAVPETVPAAPDAAPVMPAAAPIVAPAAPIAPAMLASAEVAAPPAHPEAAPAASAPYASPVSASYAPAGPAPYAPPGPPPPMPAATQWPVPTSPAAAARDGPAAGVPWSLGPAIGRAAIGTFLWVLFQFGGYLYSHKGLIDDASALDPVSTAFGELTFGLAILMGAVVGIAEKFVQALRFPGGSVYRFVGGNRWGAAALLGAVTGTTIGLGVEAVYTYVHWGDLRGLGPEIPFLAALGFVIAEAVVGRSPARRDEPSRTS